MGPLAGYKIIEIVGLGPGPFAGMMLADMGAELTAIARPGPRTLGDMKHDINRRGKTFLEIDLKTENGRAEALALIAEADALIEGARPGVMERLGLGPVECFECNQRLVYGRMTGWGQDGPLSQAAGHDLNYASLAGAIYSMGKQDQPPPVPLNLVADYGGGGMFLAFGVVCALLEASKSGKGQVVDASMVEGASLMMSLFHSLRASGMWNDKRGHNFLDGGAHFYNNYETSDGKYISLGAIEPQFAAEFANLTGLDQQILAEHMNPQSWPQLHGLLTNLFLTKSQDEWCALLEGSDACFAPVLPFWEAHRHAHNQARASFVELDGIIQPAPTPRFSRTPAKLRDAKPAS